MECQSLLLVYLGFVSISGGHSQPLGNANHRLEEVNFGFEENATSSGGVRVESGVVTEFGDSPEGHHVIQDRQEDVTQLRNSLKTWLNTAREPCQHLDCAIQQPENDAASALNEELVDILETEVGVHDNELNSIRVSAEAVEYLVGKRIIGDNQI